MPDTQDRQDGQTMNMVAGKRRGVIMFLDIERTLDAVGPNLAEDGSLIEDIHLLSRLTAMAGLRDGEQPRAVKLDPARDVIYLYLEGGWMPHTFTGCEAPVVHTVVTL